MLAARLHVHSASRSSPCPQLSPLAALLFAPTQVWVTIAAKLNWDIVQLNSGGNEAGKKQK